MKVIKDRFVERQTKTNFKGTKLTMKQLQEIEVACNEIPESEWSTGYAEFVRIVKIYKPDILCPIIKITSHIESYIKSGYETRREGELPYLTRWVSEEVAKGTPAHVVKVVLYSRQHLVENNETELTSGDWVIVSVNAELDVEVPISPETMLRNHMGSDFGGSGHPLNKEEFLKSVQFWEKHVMIKG